MIPLPGVNSHVGVSPPISRPPASRPAARKRATAPVRTELEAGTTCTPATAPDTTSTAHFVVAPPAVALIVARPGASACRLPSPPTRTTLGTELAHCTASLR